MKRTLLTSSLLLIACFGFAQFQKGNKVLGFGLAFSTGNAETQNNSFAPVTKSNSLNSSVELGFSTRENRLHGFFVGAAASKNTSESRQPVVNISKNRSQSFNAGYFTRMYKSLGKEFYVFGDLRGGYYYTENKNNNGTISNAETTQKIHNASVSLFPGIAYRLRNRFLLEVRTGDIVSMGYNSTINTNNNNNQKFVSNNFSFNSSLGLGFLQNFGIGARWILGRTK